eukprot:CAMPEP_0115007030 /NCGR_PEP_ID=MMETSP0216-20121206/20891_1 /TAXON_ID=223996 /ORGANISM="Protocruzia adherens, Strain Boccale" /LENGTH=131 /DNA_ID=CAMNT_0002373803 /DNA_START=105 /DNA_END=497 /DNA_ORIENTATION=+
MSSIKHRNLNRKSLLNAFLVPDSYRHRESKRWKPSELDTDIGSPSDVKSKKAELRSLALSKLTSNHPHEAQFYKHRLGGRNPNEEYFPRTARPVIAKPEFYSPQTKNSKVFDFGSAGKQKSTNNSPSSPGC